MTVDLKELRALTHENLHFPGSHIANAIKNVLQEVIHNWNVPNQGTASGPSEGFFLGTAVCTDAASLRSHSVMDDNKKWKKKMKCCYRIYTLRGVWGGVAPLPLKHVPSDFVIRFQSF